MPFHGAFQVRLRMVFFAHNELINKKLASIRRFSVALF